MTLHALKQYISYRYKAKNLHGVHSPFAYELQEKVFALKNASAIPEKLQPYKWLQPHYFTLLHKLIEYYNYSSLICLTHDNEDDPVAYDLLLMKDLNPGDWVRMFNKHIPYLKNNSGILVDGIHKTKRHTTKWHRLCKHPKVLMSIDLYGVGLLFFRKEFKEKQHFVLKY